MNSFTWYRALTSATLLSLAALASTGCALSPETELEPESESDESVSSESEALSPNWKCDVGQLGTSRCQATIADIRAQAAAVGREGILERGIGWLEQGVIYNRSGSFQGYRRDCSGFVSMCWEYKDSPYTGLLPPFVQNTYAVELGSLDELAPGDAVNKTFRNPYGHVMLFAGWATADHSQLYFIHHYATGKPVALVQIARSGLGDFIAIRSSKAAAPTASVTPKPEEPPPQAPPSGCGVMVPNQALGIDQVATSCDGRFSLVQQSDGNLVLYQDGAGARWSTQTNGSGGEATVMQSDGNLVIYAAGGKPVWSSGTSGYAGAWLSIRDDGSVVIDTGSKLVWWNGIGGY
jgi:hypothetical protein